MLKEFRAQYPQYDDMADDDLMKALSAKGLINVNHDDLADGVTASTSHELQAKAPEVKPVVKGTKSEVLRMKMSGEIQPGNAVFVGGDDTAYIINLAAVQGIYGDSVQKSLNMAKKDLKSGGDMESLLLGYPNRSGEEKQTAAVDREGNVLTDLGEIAANKDNILWAAEGEPEDVQGHAERVAKKWKTIGEEIGGDDEGNSQTTEGTNEGAKDDDAAEEDRREEVGKGADALRPVVIVNGKKIIGKVGQTHDEVLQDNNKPISIKTRGFATPNGRVLNRKMAMEWLKNNDSSTYDKLKAAGVKELHTEVYNMASGAKA